jgi:hypothetical protein
VLVAVGCRVGLAVGVGVRGGVGVKLGVAVGLRVRVAVAVGDRVAVGLGVLVGVHVAVGVGVGLGLGSATVAVDLSVTLATGFGVDDMGVNPGVVGVASPRVAVALEVANCACGGSDNGRRIKRSATSRTTTAPPIISRALGARPFLAGIGGETSACSSSTAAPVAIL